MFKNGPVLCLAGTDIIDQVRYKACDTNKDCRLDRDRQKSDGIRVPEQVPGELVDNCADAGYDDPAPGKCIR